jgi:hypothetical protein
MNTGLFAVAAAIIGAGLTATLGVWLTLSKTRKERGFDRRLVWCESMMSALNAAGAAVTSASTGSDATGHEECWTETIRLYEQLIPLCGQKEMYAPTPAVNAIQAFMIAFAALIESHLASHATSGSAADCEHCLAELRRTTALLAGIGRSHLGLEPLPRDVTDPSRMLLGSFRGRELGPHQAAFSRGTVVGRP